MSETQNLEPILLLTGGNIRPKQNWSGQGDCSSVRLVHVKKGTYNGRPASLVVLHFQLASKKRFDYAAFEIRITPVPYIGGKSATPHSTTHPEKAVLTLSEQSPPAETPVDPPLAATAPNRRAVHFSPSLPNNHPKGFFSDTTARLAAELSQRRSKIRQLLKDTDYRSGTATRRRIESAHVQVVAVGPQKVRGPTRPVPRDLEYTEKYKPEVEAEHVKLKFWQRGQKVAEHHPDSLGGSLGVEPDQSWLRVSAEKSDLKKSSCPKRFPIVFVVRHTCPIQILVSPPADIKSTLSWNEPVLTCLENHTQTNQPSTCLRRDNGGQPLCPGECAEFNHTHMTIDSWKKLLVVQDLKHWDWDENDDVSLCVREVDADSTRNG